MARIKYPKSYAQSTTAAESSLEEYMNGDCELQHVIDTNALSLKKHLGLLLDQGLDVASIILPILNISLQQSDSEATVAVDVEKPIKEVQVEVVREVAKPRPVRLRKSQLNKSTEISNPADSESSESAISLPTKKATLSSIEKLRKIDALFEQVTDSQKRRREEDAQIAKGSREIKESKFDLNLGGEYLDLDPELDLEIAINSKKSQEFTFQDALALGRLDLSIRKIEGSCYDAFAELKVFLASGCTRPSTAAKMKEYAEEIKAGILELTKNSKYILSSQVKILTEYFLIACALEERIKEGQFIIPSSEKDIWAELAEKKAILRFGEFTSQLVDSHSILEAQIYLWSNNEILSDDTLDSHILVREKPPLRLESEFLESDLPRQPALEIPCKYLQCDLEHPLAKENKKLKQRLEQANNKLANEKEKLASTLKQMAAQDAKLDKEVTSKLQCQIQYWYAPYSSDLSCDLPQLIRQETEFLEYDGYQCDTKVESVNELKELTIFLLRVELAKCCGLTPCICPSEVTQADSTIPPMPREAPQPGHEWKYCDAFLFDWYQGEIPEYVEDKPVVEVQVEKPEPTKTWRDTIRSTEETLNISFEPGPKPTEAPKEGHEWVCDEVWGWVQEQKQEESVEAEAEPEEVKVEVEQPPSSKSRKEELAEFFQDKLIIQTATTHSHHDLTIPKAEQIVEKYGSLLQCYTDKKVTVYPSFIKELILQLWKLWGPAFNQKSLHPKVLDSLERFLKSFDVPNPHERDKQKILENYNFYRDKKYLLDAPSFSELAKSYPEPLLYKEIIRQLKMIHKNHLLIQNFD